MSDDLQTLWEPRMSKPVMTDNERAARLAGWEPGQDYGPYPDYENSIDAQMADLDPLVEAKWGVLDESVHYSNHKLIWVYRLDRRLFPVYGPMAKPTPACFVGRGPTRKKARLKALLAALEAQP